MKRGGGEVGVDMEGGGGGLPLFYYVTVQLHLLCGCVGKVRFSLLLFGSSVF